MRCQALWQVTPRAKPQPTARWCVYVRRHGMFGPALLVTQEVCEPAECHTATSGGCSALDVELPANWLTVDGTLNAPGASGRRMMANKTPLVGLT
jgi:hypothetical protein